MMSKKKTLLLLFALGVLIRIIYFLITPLGEAPDEKSHFSISYYYALRFSFPDKNISHLPHFSFEYPPLYYLVNGLFLSPVVNFPPLSTLEAFYKYGIFLRLESLVISIIVMLLVSKIIISLYPRPALIALAIIYLWPQFVGSSFWLKMDPLFLLLITVGVYIGIKVLAKPPSISFAVFLGFISSLAILTKPQGPMLLIAVLTVLVGLPFWKKKRFAAITIILLTTLLLTAWYYIKIYRISGDPFGIAAMAQELSIYTQPFSFSFYPLAVAWFTVETFIASWGPTNNIRLPLVVYFIIASFSFLFILKNFNRKHFSTLVKSKKQKIFMTLILTMTIVSLAQHLIINFMVSFQPQGRYLYPLFFLFPLLMSFGMQKGESHQRIKILSSLLIVSLLFLNIWGMHCVSSIYRTSIFPKGLGCTYLRVKLPLWQEPIFILPK